MRRVHRRHSFGRKAAMLAAILPFALAVCLVDAGPAAAQPEAPPPTETQIGSSDGVDRSDRFLVQYRTEEGLQQGIEELTEAGVDAEPLTDAGPFVAAASLGPADAAALRRDPTVLAVEVNSVFTSTATQTDPPWGLDRVDQRDRPLDTTYRYVSTGAGVTAYVLDSGLNMTHTEFTGRVPHWAYWNYGDGMGASDCYGHGTHVSGTLGGTTYGVAKSVSIVPVRVLDCNGEGTTEAVISGIDWVIADHVAGQPAVANLSIGGPPSAIVDSQVQAMINDGITVVVAAGNEGQSTCDVSPARLPAAITVGASEIDDAVALYSNYGPCNDLFAPGTDVLSAFIGSNTASETASGTSMAAPHVAGAVARYLQSNPTATPAQVAAALDSAATLGSLSQTFGGDPNKLLYIDSGYRKLSVTKGGTGGGWVASPAAGISCGGACEAWLLTGTVVTLTASAGSDSVFSEWNGGCTGIGSCQLTLNNSTTVSARFAYTNGQSFVPLAPARLMDTRPSGFTVDGIAQRVGVRTAGTTTRLTVAGRGGVDEGAMAAVFNVTVVTPAAGGFLMVYPCNAGRPDASNINFVAGQTVANSATVRLGGGDEVCVFTSQTTHVIVDVGGYYSHHPSFVALPPARLFDTRGAASIPAAGSSTSVVVAGYGGVASSAVAAVLNVTVIRPSGSGFATVYPCDQQRPNASNLNFVAGQTVANSATVLLSAGGDVCIYTTQAMDMAVDVSGYYTSTTSFTSLPPTRLMDTRTSGITVDGQAQAIGIRASDTTTPLQVTNRGGVHNDASAIVLNVTIVAPAGTGFATIFPCGTARPNASNLNFVAGRTVPNAVTVKVGAGGTICVYTSQAAHVLVDVAGFQMAV